MFSLIMFYYFTLTQNWRQKEKRFLTKKRKRNNVHLSCLYVVTGNLTLTYVVNLVIMGIMLQRVAMDWNIIIMGIVATQGLVS